MPSLRLAPAVLIAALAGCGGGGGGSPVLQPGPPAVLPQTSASSDYLPFASGSRWQFDTGASVADAGSVTIACSCAADGKAAEEMDVTNAYATYVGSFYFAKVAYPSAPAAGHTVVTLVGSSTGRGTSISLLYYSSDGTVVGAPSVDETPAAGESFTVGPPQGVSNGSVSDTITAIDGTVHFADLYTATNVASTTIASAGQSLGFGYAPGEGFATITQDGQKATVTSYAVLGVTRSAAGPSRRVAAALRPGAAAALAAVAHGLAAR